MLALTVVFTLILQISLRECILSLADLFWTSTVRASFEVDLIVTGFEPNFTSRDFSMSQGDNLRFSFCGICTLK